MLSRLVPGLLASFTSAALSVAPRRPSSRTMYCISFGLGMLLGCQMALSSRFETTPSLIRSPFVCCPSISFWTTAPVTYEMRCFNLPFFGFACRVVQSSCQSQYSIPQLLVWGWQEFGFTSGLLASCWQGLFLGHVSGNSAGRCTALC